ncbi:hypothetical protein [Rhodococcus triatomae]|nr:hypothetical protein G419_14364 [Rhodococcus triatomae BKS 15-14]
MRKIAAAVVATAAAAGMALANTGTAQAITDSFGSGLWTVHEDIYTGIYETIDVAEYVPCRISYYNSDWNQVGYFESQVGQHVRMTVGWNDVHISTSYGCGMWRRVGDVPPPPPVDPLVALAPLGIIAGVGSAAVGSSMLPSVLAIALTGS